MAGEAIAALARQRMARKMAKPKPAAYLAQAVGGIYQGWQHARARAHQESMDSAQLQIRQGYLDLARDKFRESRSDRRQGRQDRIASVLAGAGIRPGGELNSLADENTRRRSIMEKWNAKQRKWAAQLQTMTVEQRQLKIDELKRDAIREAAAETRTSELHPFKVTQERAAAHQARYRSWVFDNPEAAAVLARKREGTPASGDTPEEQQAAAESWMKWFKAHGMPPHTAGYGPVMGANAAAGRSPLTNVPRPDKPTTDKAVRDTVWEQAWKEAVRVFNSDAENWGMSQEDKITRIKALANGFYRGMVRDADDKVGDHAKAEAEDDGGRVASERGGRCTGAGPGGRATHAR